MLPICLSLDSLYKLVLLPLLFTITIIGYSRNLVAKASGNKTGKEELLR